MSRHDCTHTDESTHSFLTCTEDPVERWTCSSHVCLEQPAVENSQPQPHLRHSSGKSCSKSSGIWTHQAGIQRNQSAVSLTCYFTHDLKSGMSLPPNMFCSKGYIEGIVTKVKKVFKNNNKNKSGSVFKMPCWFSISTKRERQKKKRKKK